MSKLLFPILLVILSIGLYFTYLSPAYDILLAFQAQSEELDNTIKESQKFIELHNSLLEKFSSIPASHRANISKILPDAIDVVRLILDVDALAGKHNLVIRSFDVPQIENSETSNSKSAQEVGEVNENVGSAVITIECAGKYTDLKNFLSEIETSMALMDVVELQVETVDLSQPGAVRENMYTLGLQAYWLK
jgi:Tfp pilus assembly protein PilO